MLEKKVIHKLADGSDCPLCVREELTHLYFEDHFLWIVLCKSCHVPMITWKVHKHYLEPKELKYVLLISKQLFGTIDIDTTMRTIPHWHAHIR